MSPKRFDFKVRVSFEEGKTAKKIEFSKFRLAEILESTGSSDHFLSVISVVLKVSEYHWEYSIRYRDDINI